MNINEVKFASSADIDRIFKDVQAPFTVSKALKVPPLLCTALKVVLVHAFDTFRLIDVCYVLSDSPTIVRLHWWRLALQLNFVWVVLVHLLIFPR